MSALEHTFIRRWVDELDPPELRIFSIYERRHKVNVPSVPNGVNNKTHHLSGTVTNGQ